MNKRIFFILTLLSLSIFITNFKSFTKDLFNYEVPDEIINDFYSIGWSKDGKYSYIELKDGGGRCYYLFRFIITDLSKDKIIFNIDFYSDENYDDNVTNNKEYFNFIWKSKKNQIIDKLKEFKIIPVKSKLKYFPIKSKDDYINLIIDKKTIEDDIWDEKISSLILWIDSKKFGKKLIYKNTNENELLFVNISGYLLSPFEERIAIIMVRTFPGWEGPLNEIIFNVIGCHLSKDFQ